MITAQLGPPPAVPGRASTAEGSAGDDAPGAPTVAEDGAFVALLLGLGPSVDGAGNMTQPSPAAGPLTGELPTVTDADAAGLTPTPVDTAAVPVPGGRSDAQPVVPPGASTAAVATVAPHAAAPGETARQPPAVVSGGPTQAPASGSSPVPVPGPAPSATTRGDAAGAPAASAPPAQPGAGTAGTATVTVTLSRAEPPPAASPGSGGGRVLPEGGAAAAAAARSVPPPAAAAAPADPAPATVPTPAGPVPVPGLVAQGATAGTTHVGVPPGVTSAAELAHELGARMRMAVREGGRELVVNLRPPELGHLTVRVTMIDGVLTAQITADRPDAARLLQQSLAQLGTVLGDLGYTVDGLDVAYEGHDPRDASGSSPGGQAADAGADGTVDGESGATPVSSNAAAVTDGDRLDLLA